LATDAQAAQLTAQYAGENAGGGVYAAIQTPVITVGEIDDSTGDLNVLIVMPNTPTGTTFQDVGVLPQNILASVGASSSGAMGSKTNLNRAQTASVLNALAAAEAAQSTPASSSGGSTSTGATASTGPLGIPIWGWAAAGAAVALLVLMKGK
jgi:hypothetical protein